MWSHSDGPVLLFWWTRFQKTTGLNWVVWLRPSKSSLATWLRPYLLSSFSKLKIARCFDKTNYRSISSTVLAIHLFIQNQSFSYASITIMPKSVIRESQALFHFQKFFEISFDGVNFESTGSSEYAHGYTLGLANYKGLGLIEFEIVIFTLNETLGKEKQWQQAVTNSRVNALWKLNSWTCLPCNGQMGLNTLSHQSKITSISSF